MMTVSNMMRRGRTWRQNLRNISTHLLREKGTFKLNVHLDSSQLHSIADIRLFCLTSLVFTLTAVRAADAEIKVSSGEDTELKRSPFTAGGGQYVAILATLTARHFFLAYFYIPVHSPAFFLQNLSRFLLCWLWLTHGSCVGLQNKIGYRAGCRFLC